MSNLIKLYELDIKNKKIFYDEKQEIVIKELDNLNKILIANVKKKENIFFSDILNFLNKTEFLGLYIWGDVGRGKTYLVDLFYLNLTINKKIRLHYHHFMKIVHNKLTETSGKKNPLKIIARWFYENYSIICLDEFFVKDIADAMNLATLFKYLFELNIFLIVTSNVIPNKLYEGGLQRQKFIPTISLIEKYLKIINIDGKTDYRFKNLKKENIYTYPLSIKNLKYFRSIFFKLSTIKPKKKHNLEILGRIIKTVYTSGSIVWFTFSNICGENRSQLDYIEIASLFDTIFLSGVKKMSSKNDDETRRFISLVDELYDRKINLITLAETNIENLYSGDILKFDIKRTMSRLNEMSTNEYIKDFDKNVF
ncbi:MAG TPA: cell division protein ZapE [Candidatus Azoamicus sp.]